jgi:hypothetical protein
MTLPPRSPGRLRHGGTAREQASLAGDGLLDAPRLYPEVAMRLISVLIFIWPKLICH